VVQVSILLSTFNGASFLREQLDSILAQSFTDFELLAIDDGSVDATPAILREYAARDPRIRVKRSQGNRRQKQRLAELLPHARGSFISIADQDDVWHPERTATLLAGLEGVALAFGRSDLIDAEGRLLGQTLLELLGEPPQPEDRLVYLFAPRISGHAMLVRRKVVSEAAFRRVHPYDWLVGLDALFAGGIRYVDDAIVNHRIHDSNQSNGRELRQAWASGQSGIEGEPPAPAKPHKTPQGKRLRLVNRLEHLLMSPFTPAELVRTAAAVRNLCVRRWFVTPRPHPLGDEELRQRIELLLAPFSDGGPDWQRCREHLARLT
jgi:glycosyltransferase involved in cell wall biosynthesis